MTTALEPQPWSSTRQGRKELAAAGLFVLAFATAPLVRAELYPFSRAPMFSDAPRQYCEFRIVAPDGRSLNLQDFDVQRNYWGNPLGVGVGFEPPPSLDEFGTVPASAAVKHWIEKRLARFPYLSHVDVTENRIAAEDDRKIGVVEQSTIRVENPNLRGAAR
jgi:hypothetical protein